eukprot:NODE_14218_length_346_cov_1.781145_g13056_i0.p5 GENE.NODE_14218_length_346_cov_1.781145_g13056_i0~~NODE_14218_length_346_cov_1.781145_g13056_i0.p5  ORF type:complete len:51 (+),score=1.90 NODE_14218_length_346_cov_1.781145_g13056_i0:190-342(+)
MLVPCRVMTRLRRRKPTPDPQSPPGPFRAKRREKPSFSAAWWQQHPPLQR